MVSIPPESSSPSSTPIDPAAGDPTTCSCRADGGRADVPQPLAEHPLPTYLELEQANQRLQTRLEDQQRAYVALQASHQRLCFAMEAAQVGIWRWDRATNKTYWSETNYRLMGYEPGDYETTFDLWLQAIHPDDRDWILAAIQQTLEQGTDLHMDYRVQLPDGSIRWLRDLGKVLVDDQGQPYAMTGIQIDITETHLAQAALEQSEARLTQEIAQHHDNENRFQLALEGSGDGLWDWTIATNQVYFDPRWLAMLGYQVGDLAETFHTLTELIHPADRPQVLTLLQQHLQQEGYPYRFEYRLRTRTGQWKWIANYSKVIARDRQGQPLRMVGTHRDIDARKQAEAALAESEELFHAFMAQIPMAAWIADQDGQIQVANQALAKAFNLPLTAILGKNLLDLIPRDVGQDYLAQQRQVIQTQQPHTGVEYLAQSIGPPISYLVHRFPICRASGEWQAGGVAIDITDRLRAEAELRQNQALLQEAQRVAQIGNWSFDLRSQKLTWSQQVFQILGFDADQPEPTLEEHLTLIHPDDRDKWQTSVDQALIHRQGYVIDFRAIHPNGTLCVVEARGEVEVDDQGEVVRLFGTVQDITERQYLEDALRSQVQKEQALNRIIRSIRQSFDLTTIFTTTQTEIGQSVEAERVDILQYTAEQNPWRNVADHRCAPDLPGALGLPWADPKPSVTERLQRLEVVQVDPSPAQLPGISAPQPGHWLLVPLPSDNRLWGVLSLVKPAISPWRDHEIELLRSVATQLTLAIHQAHLYQQVQQELSQRQQMEAVLRHRAMHDALTDLPNRNLLLSSLEFALKRICHQPDYQFAVLFLDLDRFKLVNDSWGHLAGDQLLQSIAQILRQIVRPIDIAARLGGDEFVILLDGITDITDVTRVIDRLFAHLHTPIMVQGRPVYVTASIGVVISSTDYHNPADMLRDADIAMYQAKAQGKNCYALFDPGFHVKMVRQLQLDHDLRQALINGQFLLYYQPVVTLTTREIVGFEALVRWQHPQFGLLPPDDFIPLAEETGLIVELGQWILRAACTQLQHWQRQFPQLGGLKMNVNLSVEQLNHPGLIIQLKQLLADTGLVPQSLTLEITESMLISNTDYMINLIEQIQTLNLQIAIDDFGTGYSSLSYLHRFPINALKIDKTFTQNLSQDQINLDIVDTIITLADRLGLVVVAEGIETAEHLAILLELGCEQGQGYYFARPLTAAAMTARLTQGSSDRHPPCA